MNACHSAKKCGPSSYWALDTQFFRAQKYGGGGALDNLERGGGYMCIGIYCMCKHWPFAQQSIDC